VQAWCSERSGAIRPGGRPTESEEILLFANIAPPPLLLTPFLSVRDLRGQILRWSVIMRTAPTNAAIPVPPHLPPRAPRVWKIQLPTKLPLTEEMSQTARTLRPSWRSRQPAAHQSDEADAPNISRCMTRFSLTGVLRPRSPRSRLTYCLYHYINYI